MGGMGDDKLSNQSYAFMGYDAFCFRQNKLKKIIISRLSAINFYVPVDNNLNFQLLYSEEANPLTLLNKMVQVMYSTLTNTDSFDDTDHDVSFGSFHIPIPQSNFKLEFYHMCEAIKQTFQDIPRDFVTYPPQLTDFTVSSCLKYCPPLLYNLIACICGLNNTEEDDGIVCNPHERIQLSESKQSKVASICQDIVYLQSNGKTQTPKALALGLTLRHLTADKRINHLLFNFGHAASYKKVIRLETALAAQQLATAIPAGFVSGMWSAVVWDNIDFSNETLSGSGSVHYVNGILLQKQTAACESEPFTPQVPVPSTSKAMNKLPDYDKRIATFVPHSKKQGPSLTTPPSTQTLSALNENHDDFLYILVKYAHHDPASIPCWTSFNQILNHGRGLSSVPTRIHYLPLIEAPATEDRTILTILCRTIEIADELKLTKIVAVFDLAIYAKVQQLRWADPSRVYIERVIPRLGEFHTIMSFLSILGKRFGSGGLSDIWVQSEVVAVGSLNAALQGKHYNRAIRGHKVVYEALCRLLLEDFITSLSESDQTNLLTLADELSTSYRENNPLMYDSQFTEFYSLFSDYVYNKAAANPTYRYWMSYLQMVQLLLAFIRASRLSDWDQHLNCIDNMIPWYFAYDRRNYAR